MTRISMTVATATSGQGTIAARSLFVSEREIRSGEREREKERVGYVVR